MLTLNARLAPVDANPKPELPPGAKPMPYLFCTAVCGLASYSLAQYSSAEVIAIITAIVGGTTAILSGGAAALAKVISVLNHLPKKTREQMDQTAMPTTPAELAAMEDRIANKLVAKLDARDRAQAGKPPSVQT